MIAVWDGFGGGGIKFEVVETGIKFWYVKPVYATFAVELSWAVFSIFFPDFLLRDWWCTRLFSGIGLVLGGPLVG